MANAKKVRVGLYGNNGHQLNDLLKGHPRAELVACAHYIPPKELLEELPITRHDSLLALALDPNVDLISLCSPMRSTQVEDAIVCLQNGKHVYAEKPCALSEPELDRVLAAADASRRHFREMGGSIFSSPYLQMRDVVCSGELGEIVQVFAQKSYPWHDGRPQDEMVDGGLTLQVGIHAARFVEHVTGIRISLLDLQETAHGNPVPNGGSRMAATLQGRLENGALVTLVANYLNQRGLGAWGNDHLRIFGTKGFVESVDGGKRTALVIGEAPARELPALEKPIDHADAYFRLILENEPMPLSLEEELHPLRALLRVKRFEGIG
jgi:predicted dehydrogenase